MSDFESKSETEVLANPLPVGETEDGNTRTPGKTNGQSLTGSNFSLRRFRAEAEIQAICRALEQTGWHRKRAAQLLRISYRGLLYKIHQHHITRAEALAPSSAPKAE